MVIRQAGQDAQRIVGQRAIRRHGLRLAGIRMRKAIQGIKLVGNLPALQASNAVRR